MPGNTVTLDEAKALLEGQFGVELEKYPLKFAIPAYFGARPHPGEPAIVSNGTASLLRLNGQAFALTCSHVLDGFREQLTKGPSIFQLGNCVLDPLAQIAKEDSHLDYALISLTASQAEEISKPDGPFGGTYFCEPQVWPPAEVREGDFVAFGGYPGQLRESVSFDELSFGSYSSGATKVTAVNDDYIVCHYEREYWVQHGCPEPAFIGGISGGPVFVIRHSEAGIMCHEFVGHVSQFSDDFELLYIQLAHGVLE